MHSEKWMQKTICLFDLEKTGQETRKVASFIHVSERMILTGELQFLAITEEKPQKFRLPWD